MLERLQVRSLGIIENVEVTFGRGFSVLTGETGAGKSLLVEGLELIAGGRASADLVRTGDEKLVVEAWFDLLPSDRLSEEFEDLGILAADEVVVRREVTAPGRSRCWINDTAVTVGGLQRVASHLLAIHGQHEHYGLANPQTQLQLVDTFGDLGVWTGGVRNAWQRWVEESDEVQRLEAARGRRRDRLDAISFQEAEIDALAPNPGEDDELRIRRLRLRHAARLQALTSSVVDGLGDREGAVIEELARSERAVAEMADCGVDVGDLLRLVTEARVISEEALREVRVFGGDLRDDPAELERVESRLHALEQIMLKYGGTLEEVMDHRARLRAERTELEKVEDRLERSRRDADAALAAFDEAAVHLHRKRVEASRVMALEISRVLKRMDMAGTKIDFHWTPRPEEGSPLIRDGVQVAFGVDGVEEVELLMAANEGEDLRPMAKVASGGELSRLHLAIRTVLRQRDQSQDLTLLFDEVDSGLGGGAAAALAGLLDDLARHDQVLVVTHLAQVAGRAQAQFKVEKTVSGGRTTTSVMKVEGEARTQEVARMVAGEAVTDTARSHAAELLSETAAE
ncbi:MAG: DNA repair protein RecN [Acidobacteria bacterium]|nr:DNA repair protein RecN [Acidobacteriota bacterium]